MATSQQSTFGEITVQESRGNYQCDKVLEFEDNGEPVRCPNSDSIVIVHESTGTIVYRCKTHAKQTWLEMIDEK